MITPPCTGVLLDAIQDHFLASALTIAHLSPFTGLRTLGAAMSKTLRSLQRASTSRTSLRRQTSRPWCSCLAPSALLWPSSTCPTLERSACVDYVSAFTANAHLIRFPVSLSCFCALDGKCEVQHNGQRCHGAGGAPWCARVRPRVSRGAGAADLVL